MGDGVELRDVRLRLGESGGHPVEFRLDKFHAARGELVALTGPSGCGKSTLLNVVSGLVRPGAGIVRVLGRDLASLSGWGLDGFRGRSLGFIYQGFNLLDSFSAIENVMIGMRFGRAVARGERRSRAAALLERVGLGHRMDSRPARLSVGERQRVAIARAVANRPGLLLADEPTGALDPATAESVFQLLLEVCAQEQCGLLLVTHDLELAARVGRRFDCRSLVRQEPAA